MPLSVVYATVNGVLVEEDRGGAVTCYVSDTLGSVVKTTDAAGAVTSTASYWPFGEVRTSTGTNPSPWGFVGTLGYYKDALAKLYVRMRILRTDLAGWMSADPLWPEEAAYQYCIDSPVLVTDPSGLAPSCLCGSPPKVFGVKPSHPKYKCYLDVCKWYSSICKPPLEESDCSGWPSCNGINGQYKPCMPSDECYSSCHRSGGNPTPGGGQTLPDWCCVECQIRVCCHVVCPLEKKLGKILKDKFKKCDKGVKP